ncbi:MAG: hypothetical protein HY291_18210 [Planctomycetes bacterium]|nr:hypothetical protein [Planctomycetota bacterium]
MAGNKPLSWKWKLLIALVVLILVGIGFVFTPWGHSTMQNWINKSYDELPPAERADSTLADSQLKLAYWEGNICQASQKAQETYLDFLGLSNPNFFQRYADTGRMEWSGKFENTGKTPYTGWGIMHPRAPEAFFNYLDLYQEGKSGQFIKDEAAKYYVLFYEMYPKIAKKHGKPHPQFYVYWDKIKNGFIMKYKGPMPHVDPKPPEYEGPIEQKEGKQ